MFPQYFMLKLEDSFEGLNHLNESIIGDISQMNDLIDEQLSLLTNGKTNVSKSDHKNDKEFTLNKEPRIFPGKDFVP
jgi:hypothetical protein